MDLISRQQYIVLAKTLKKNRMNKLIYFGDPMCSWCYGFAPELKEIISNLPEVEFELVLGGLRPYGKEPINSMKNFLLKHWIKIQESTGQPFSHDILDDENFYYDTEPANRAVVTARALKPSIDLEFYDAVQTAFYAKSKDVLKAETFVNIAEDFELDSAKYAQLFDSQEIKDKTRQSFSYTIEQGINAFPTLVLETPSRKYLLSRGYQKAAPLLQQINEVLSSPS